MIGGNDDDDDDECIFGEGERNVDLSLRERVGIFGIPFATCTDRSLVSAAAADMSRGKKREEKKKKSFDMS